MGGRICPFDRLFDGRADAPYTPADAVNPLGQYGRSKAAGEAAIRQALPAHLILRTSWVFGRHGGNFVKTMLRLARDRDALNIVDDQIGGPTPAAAIAEAALLCKGADHRLPATAVRAYAAGLLPLGALLLAAQHEDGLAPSPSRRRGVALALLASAAVQANALRDDGHALRRWARRSILPPIVAAGAVGAWGAVKA